ncbi:MAG: DUF4142 domain-containing protein [Minicystis sp.]
MSTRQHRCLASAFALLLLGGTSACAGRGGTQGGGGQTGNTQPGGANTQPGNRTVQPGGGQPGGGGTAQPGGRGGSQRGRVPGQGRGGTAGGGTVGGGRGGAPGVGGQRGGGQLGGGQAGGGTIGGQAGGGQLGGQGGGQLGGQAGGGQLGGQGGGQLGGQAGGGQLGGQAGGGQAGGQAGGGQLGGQAGGGQAGGVIGGERDTEIEGVCAGVRNMGNQGAQASPDAIQCESGQGAAVPGSDSEIAGILNQLNHIEVNESAHAEKHAQSASVRDFARLMLIQHSRSLMENRMLFERLSIQPAEVQSIEGGQLLGFSQLTTLGGDLDREYMRRQILEHQNSLNLAESMLDRVENADVRCALDKTRQVSAVHLEMACWIWDSLQAGQQGARSGRRSQFSGQQSTVLPEASQGTEQSSEEECEEEAGGEEQQATGGEGQQATGGEGQQATGGEGQQATGGQHAGRASKRPNQGFVFQID